MKKDVFLWLRRCQFPLLLLLSFMPLILIALCIEAPDAVGASWVMFAAYTALSGLCLLVPGSKRMLCATFSSVFMFALSVVVFSLRAKPLLLLLPAALTALLFFSLPLAARRYESEVPPFVYFSGVAVHIVVHFLNHHFTGSSGVSPYAPVSRALTASLIGYMLLFLLSMNRISLDNASLARHRIPAGMRGVNTAMTILFITAALALSMVPAIIRSITALWRMLCDAVTRICVFLISLLPSGEDPGFGAPGGENGFIPMGEIETEPSAFAVLIERIASVLTLLILIVGVIILIRLLIRLITRLVRHITARLRTYMTAASAEYEDEVTDTREDGAQREIRFLRRSRRAGMVYDDTSAGRIRMSYARLIRRNPSWSSSSTARENLPESAAALYERARYSDHPLTEEDVRRFADDTRRL